MSDPQTLFAIVYAAHAQGDRSLERQARAQLEELFGVRVVFKKGGANEQM